MGEAKMWKYLEKREERIRELELRNMRGNGGKHRTYMGCETAGDKIKEQWVRAVND